MQPLLKIGTRNSPLALKQVELVVHALGQANSRYHDPVNIEVVPILTSGDKALGKGLSTIGGKGLFTKEIDEALLAGDVDIAVHSAKDMQTELPEGLMFAAALEREDVRDVLVSHACHTLNTLPKGAKVGTSSLRRAQILQNRRKDLFIEPIRGNLQTRIRKVEEHQYDATILALAGLKRLEIDPLPGTILELDEMLPAPAQGIIAIQCRKSDAHMQQLLSAINHAPTMQAATLERAILKALDGSCKTPIAVYAEPDRESVRIRAMLGNESTGKMAFAELRETNMPADDMVQTIVKSLKAPLE